MLAYRLLCLFLDCTRTDLLQRVLPDLLEPPVPPDEPEVPPAEVPEVPPAEVPEVPPAEEPEPAPDLPTSPEEGTTSPIYVEVWQPGPSGAVEMIWPPDYYQRVIAETTDGRIMKWGYPLLDVRDAGVGDEIYTGLSSSSWAMTTRRLSSGIYRIYRSFFAFDLTGLPSGSVKAAWLTFYKSTARQSSVCVQEGIQADVLTLDDFDAFEDTLFSWIQWPRYEVSMPLNQAGMDYVASKRGSVAKFCLREYDHDYLCVEFAKNLIYNNGLYYSEYPDETRKPTLVIDI